MFYIVEVLGCEPYVDVILNENGKAMSFETEEAALSYAKENCAWEFRVVEF